MNLPYLIPRVVRHFLPEKIVRALLLRSIIIRPGMETGDPASAVQHYVDALTERGLSFQGKRVLVFGYGGRFDFGLGLLKRGAAHVILCDKYAQPDEEHNRRLFAAAEKYLSLVENRVRPRPEWMTLFQGDIRAARGWTDLADIVVSNSVYEHLDDVEGITGALASLMKPHGLQIHFVDLRDHFFKYPFEMLCFSEKVWRNWLNPSSNHNRYRLWNYRKAFLDCFNQVEVKILAREEEAFHRAMPRIRREFISGNMEEDCATLIRVIASEPIGRQSSVSLEE